MSFRYWVTRSDHPVARTIRAVHGGLYHFTLPAPRIIVVPMLYVFLAIRAVIFFIRRIFFAEPLLKAYCTRYGKHVTTGIYVPWVKGRGELVLGDYVRIDGKVSIAFGARFVERPRLTLGNHTGVGHDTSFVVGRAITIGSHVRIAAGVSFRDSGGHASDPALRHAVNAEPWYRSRVTWGAIVAAAAPLIGLVVGHEIGVEERSLLVDIAMAGGSIAGAALALHGRWIAKVPIGH